MQMAIVSMNEGGATSTWQFRANDEHTKLKTKKKQKKNEKEDDGGGYKK